MELALIPRLKNLCVMFLPGRHALPCVTTYLLSFIAEMERKILSGFSPRTCRLNTQFTCIRLMLRRRLWQPFSLSGHKATSVSTVLQLGMVAMEVVVRVHKL